MRLEAYHIIAAIKELQREIVELRKNVDELRDDVRVGGNNIQFLIQGEESESDESASVNSAPATVSYELETN